MRGFPLLTLAFLALAGCTGLAADLADFEPVPSADWKPGYHFAYTSSTSSSVDGVAAAGGQAIPLHESHEGKPSPFLSYSVLNTDVQKDGEAYALAALDGSHGLVAFRLRDLQPLQVGLVQADGRPDLLLQPPAFDHSLLRFPLVKGDGWTGRLPLPALGDGMGPLGELGGVKLTSLVRGAEPLETPLGRFTAIRTEHQFSAPTVQALLEEARRQAEAEGVQFSRYDIDLDARIIVQYVPELHNVARLATVVEVDLDLAAEMRGQPASLKVHAEFEHVVELLQASFEASEPVSLEELAKSGYGSARLPGLSGAPAPARPSASLRLSASDRSIDLPEEPSTTLRASARGLEGTPRISVFDADGALVATAVASALQFTPPAAGRYTASATLGGVESTPVLLRVGYEADLDGSCPLSVPVAMAAPCDAATLALSGGVALLTFGVSADGAPLGGDLVWSDGAGQEQRFTVHPGFTGLRFDVQSPPAGLGSLHYEPAAGLPGTVTYSLRAEAAGDGDAEAPDGLHGAGQAALRLGQTLASILA